MPFNGSGTFEALDPPIFPAVTATVISSTYFNQNITDIQDGLSNCMTLDGQSVVTAVLPLNGFRFSDCSDATTGDEFATLTQVRNHPGVIFLSDVSGVDAVAGDANSAITSYIEGQLVLFYPVSSNTGDSMTLDINGIGPKPLAFSNGLTPANSVNGYTITMAAYTANGDKFVILTSDSLVMPGVVAGSKLIAGEAASFASSFEWPYAVIVEPPRAATTAASGASINSVCIIDTFVGNNFYHGSGAGVYKYYASAAASRINYLPNAINFQFAPSGSADTAITFVDMVTVDADGNAVFSGTVTGTNLAYIDQANTFTKAQTSEQVTLAFANPLAIDASLSNNFGVVLTANTVISAPTNLVAGQAISIDLDQDGTGGRTVTFNAIFKFDIASSNVVGSAANAKNTLWGKYDGTVIRCSLGRTYA